MIVSLACVKMPNNIHCVLCMHVLPEAVSRGLVYGFCSVAEQNQNCPSGTAHNPGGGRHAKCKLYR